MQRTTTLTRSTTIKIDDVTGSLRIDRENTGNKTTNPLVTDSSINSFPVTNNLDGPPNIALVVSGVTADSLDAEVSQQQNSFDKFRGADIDLLRTLDVSSTDNSMVKKKYLPLNVTSLANSNKENRYRNFHLLIVRYPECEHFQEFCIEEYNSKLKFSNFLLTVNDSSFQVPERLSSLIINQLAIFKDDPGLLIHYIKGWNRTSSFVCLLRLSSWADRWIHQSLTLEEILYLILAYDCCLFGYQIYFSNRHCLPERLLRDEGESY
ncbi:unnamed protein product [Rotaria sordida]|uniref:Uncharacterized protein n=1 Tax=Rotaria sordida TaxID=392033 RepID=A0A819MBN4_9BILA|nr:unnamed protein product [Rotaria sordida]CAF3977136.1 unnamed protein product [Rotaria sordida]